MKIDPESSPERILKSAHALLKEERVDEARALYLEVSQSENEDVRTRACLKMGIISERTDDVQAARRWYALASASPTVRTAGTASMNLALIEWSSGNFEAAQLLLMDLRESNDQLIAGRSELLLGELHSALGNLTVADVCFRTAASSSASTVAAVAMIHLAQADLRRNARDPAKEWYKMACTTSRDGDVKAESMYNLGVLAAEEDDDRGARCWFEKSIAASTGTKYRARSLIGLATINSRRDEPEARELLIQAIEIAPLAEKADAMYRLGGLYFVEGDLEDAEKWFREVVSVGEWSQTWKACFSLGVITESRGKLSEAIEWYRRVPPSSSDEMCIEALSSLHRLQSRI